MTSNYLVSVAGATCETTQYTHATNHSSLPVQIRVCSIGDVFPAPAALYTAGEIGCNAARARTLSWYVKYRQKQELKWFSCTMIHNIHT